MRVEGRRQQRHFAPHDSRADPKPRHMKLMLVSWIGDVPRAAHEWTVAICLTYIKPSHPAIGGILGGMKLWGLMAVTYFICLGEEAFTPQKGPGK